MKPIFLRLKNVGPFLDESIDFSKLDNMFLICGNTGSGKTSIFDAITYSLYGVLNGTRKNNAIDFRSKYVPNEEESFVEFVFNSNRTKYRVHRTLPCTHETRNGNITTKNATVTLEIYNNDIKDYTLFDGKKESTNAQIEKIIGLSSDDFSQIILLPQGAFADFLHKSSKDRRDMLKKLFPVSSYTDIIDIVKKQSDTLLQELKIVERNLNDLDKGFDISLAHNELEKLEKENNSLLEMQKDLQNKLQKLSADIQKISTNYDNAVTKENREKRIFELESKTEIMSNNQKLLELDNEASKIIGFVKNYNQTKKQNEDAINKNLKAKEDLKDIKNRFESINSKKEEMNFLKLNTDKDNEMLIQKEEHTKIQIKNLIEIENCEKQQKELEEKNSIVSTNRKETEDILLKLQKQKDDLLTNNIACKISVELKDGEPCPVCGSLVHPKIAMPLDTTIDLDTLISNQSKLLDVTEKELNGIETKLTEIKATIKEKKQLVSNTLNLTDKNISLKEQAENIQKQIDILKQTVLQNKKIYDDWCESYTQADKALEKIQTILEESEINLEQSRISFEESDKELTEIFSTSKFKTSEDVQNAILPEYEKKELQKSFEKWNTELETLKAQKETISISNTSSEIKKLLEETTNSKNTIQDQYNSCQQSISINTAKYTTLKNDYERYLSLEAKWKVLKENNEPLKALSDDLRGANPKNTPFDSWALGMYFEQVVEYASKRFFDISNGRYTFEIDTEENGGNSYKGLGLLVNDSYNGEKRNANTLSGGETFMASISLALALTDVVQNRSGGIELDSIFIDEGFGSLDSETLDNAMSILEKLQETKMVGIISHVEGLMTTISSKIEVEKTHMGSHIFINRM